MIYWWIRVCGKVRCLQCLNKYWQNIFGIIFVLSIKLHYALSFGVFFFFGSCTSLVKLSCVGVQKTVHQPIFSSFSGYWLIGTMNGELYVFVDQRLFHHEGKLDVQVYDMIFFFIYILQIANYYNCTKMDLDMQLPWLEDIHLPKAEVRTITSDHLCSLVVPIEVVIQSSYLYHAYSPVCFLLIWRQPLDENSRPDRNQVHQKQYLFSHFLLDLILRTMLRYVPCDRTWVADRCQIENCW